MLTLVSHNFREEARKKQEAADIAAGKVPKKKRGKKEVSSGAVAQRLPCALRSLRRQVDDETDCVCVRQVKSYPKQSMMGGD
jgi:hypothetical protein